MPEESPAHGYPLEPDQQRRILESVLTGPVVELLGEVVRRLPKPPRKPADEAAYALATERRINPMRLDIPLQDETGPFGYAWPGSRLTGDDLRRLATMENTTALSTTRLLHHCVRVAHHLFQSFILEIAAASERSRSDIRHVLTAAIEGRGDWQPLTDALLEPDAARPPEAPRRTSAAATPRHSPRTSASVDAAPNEHASLAAEALSAGLPSPSSPPHAMAKRTTEAKTHEPITDERIQDLEYRMQRLQETMEVLIGSIDEFREDLVHTFRNLPDQLPPPIHIHSLPVDPLASDFGDRINAIPPEIMDRLRREAAGGRGEQTVAAAAEGETHQAPMTDGHAAERMRPTARQGKLFA